MVEPGGTSSSVPAALGAGFGAGFRRPASGSAPVGWGAAVGWRAGKFPRQGAGILSSIVESEGLVALPEEMTLLEPGTMVDFLPFSEVAS